MAARQTRFTRARDEDRTRTCDALDTAFAEGQLTREEHRARVNRATNAQTLAELADLVGDLQGSTMTSVVPLTVSLGPRWPALLITAAVFLVIGFAIPWPHHRGSTADPGAAPDGVAAVVIAPTKLHSVGGLTGLAQQLKQSFGDALVLSATVYPDYASITRIDPAEPRGELNYSYRSGFDDPTEGGRDSDAVPGDFASIDFAKIIGLLRGAPQTVGTDAATSSAYLNITGETTGLQITIYVSDKFSKSGYLTTKADGTVMRIDPA